MGVPTSCVYTHILIILDDAEFWDQPQNSGAVFYGLVFWLGLSASLLVGRIAELHQLPTGLG